MIHHVSMQDLDDFHSLWRFLTGQAIGLVAGGGGALGTCHVGIFNAFKEAGVAFDIFGGSSAGSVMAAGFACLTETEVFKSALDDIFVRRRALSRLTWPRYGLLDHRVLEDELQRRNPGDIEDLWRPFFATATDLSTDTLRVIREGPVWQAIRASCSLPGVLPPFIDDAGHMLVDGGVRDNLPVGVMNSLKNGPNLVIDLQPTTHQLFDFSYRSIPGRGELIAHMINPWPWKKALPSCPGPASVLARSLSSRIVGKVEKKTPLELILHPPLFPGSSFMDWSRYSDVMDASYEWGRKTVETLRENGDPSLAAMLSLSGSQLQ